MERIGKRILSEEVTLGISLRDAGLDFARQDSMPPSKLVPALALVVPSELMDLDKQIHLDPVSCGMEFLFFFFKHVSKVPAK